MQANSGVLDQTPLLVVSDLGLYYLPMSHKKDARHIWVKNILRNLGSILMKLSS